MASPQKEDGFTPIANEILNHLVMPGLNGSEFRLILWVVRKTYGFAKKADQISLTQFQKATGMKRSSVVKTLKTLVAKRLLLLEKGGFVFNKNWETWVVAKRLPRSQKATKVVANRGTKVVANRLHTKERKKELKKEYAATSAAPPFSLQEAIRKMEEDPRRTINIIALYFRERKPDLRTREQAHEAIKRHLRAAKSLVPFTNDQILDGLPRAKRLTGEWTLETLSKVLTK